MAYSNGDDNFRTPIVRYYIDIRPYAPLGDAQRLRGGNSPMEPLPLIYTLPQEVQEQISRYVRKPDRYMSLASALLKRLFIHRTAKIPWSEIEILRTPRPHARPYWKPPANWERKDCKGLEFNVSHQAGMVVLVGCKTPTCPRDLRIHGNVDVSTRSPIVINPDPTAILEADSEIDEDEPEEVRIGVDIACTKEPHRTPDLSSQAKLNEWIEVFGEMFSRREQHDMKYANIPNMNTEITVEQRGRLFYTYWALKEAYIKMVGEGLLAPWLRELEFRNVPVPQICEQPKQESWTLMSEEDIHNLQVLFRSRSIAHTMQTTLEAFEDTFVVATMTRGVADLLTQDRQWRQIEPLRDIELCATGNCQCLA